MGLSLYMNLLLELFLSLGALFDVQLMSLKKIKALPALINLIANNIVLGMCLGGEGMAVICEVFQIFTINTVG